MIPGLVLETSVIIAAERAALPASQLLERVKQEYNPGAVIVSAVSVMELEHAVYRAPTAERRVRRQDFLHGLYGLVSIEAFRHETALIAARVGATEQMRGYTIPLADLLIGCTALQFGYGVLTCNVKDFSRIPGLAVHVFAL
ncbi:hypothetical protein F183_A16090 [Bryobacterales bacterium F-183]|nr:hypothetical protein F183_A16090 [Bryobacterales bacterium F-183]